MNPVRVEMVYDQTCPNVAECRVAIRLALLQAGLPPRWTEWDRNAEETPRALRVFGSPTVLVNSEDICGDQGTGIDANSCRVYQDECGCVCGAPSVALIKQAIQNAQRVVGHP